jgi:nicotinate-nucleotide adenylyltransferase
MEYTGLFLGSFNPIHQGHLILAETFASLEDMKEVWLVISPQNPFKAEEKLMDFETRTNWVQLVIQDNPRLSVSTIENSLPLPSFTINTLEALIKEFPQRTFVLLMGEDQLPDFHRWHRFRDILNLVPLWVYPRHSQNPNPSDIHIPYRMLVAPKIEISSSHIRERIRLGLSVRYLVPELIRISCSKHPFWGG